MCVPEKNPYNPIRTMYSCETLDCLGVHVCSDIDTEARSERALINVKKSPIFKTSDACRRVMLLLPLLVLLLLLLVLLLLLRERVGKRVLPEESALVLCLLLTATHTLAHVYIGVPLLYICIYAYTYIQRFSPHSPSLSPPLFPSHPPRSLPLASTRLDSPRFFPSTRPLVFSLSAVATPFRRAVLSKQRERLCPLVPAVKSWAYFKFAAFYRIRYLSTGCTSKGRRFLSSPTQTTLLCPSPTLLPYARQIKHPMLDISDIADRSSPA